MIGIDNGRFRLSALGVLIGLCIASCVWGCDSEGGTPDAGKKDGGGKDAEADAGWDGGGDPDDGGQDAGTDSGFDGGADTGVPDAGKDGGVDGGNPYAEACAGRKCADIVQGGLPCFEQTCGAGKYCGWKPDKDDPGTVAQCNNCNVSGKGDGEDCLQETDCRCGTNCNALYKSGSIPLNGPCRNDCLHTYGDCGKNSECITLSFGDGRVNADCFPVSNISTPAVPFAITLGDNCASYKKAAYKVSFAFADKTYSFDSIGACINSAGTGILIALFGMSSGGFDQIVLNFEMPKDTLATAGKKVFVWNDATKPISAKADGYTVNGGFITRFETFAFGLEGFINFTKAGTTADAPLEGTISGTMVKYNMVLCDDASGIPKKCN